MERFSHQQIAINGLSFNVMVEGQGPDVLLVHGFPDDHRVWRKQIPALVAAGFRVIAPDNRGCGQTDMAAGVLAYRMKHLIADLVGILDALGVEKVRLVGHDWGAVIAWQLCMLHPERVDRYMALSVGHPTAYARAPLEQKLKGYYIWLLQFRGVIEWALRAGNWRLFRAVAHYPFECQNWIGNLSRPGRLTAAINYYRANLQLILPRALPKPSMPILGVWSSGDRFLAEAQMRSSAQWVTGSWRYERLDGPSHWLQLDAPEMINTLMLGYLR
ncbi:MAG TPA: alpha/beta fold hydrolase [Burkholderiaceae bacterium]|nr:alpha/beta fold hydrolase [Burkholderiaceae bacterium]